jgi:hypothetical protein
MTSNEELSEMLAAAEEAAEGDSNDEELSAWRTLALAALERLGVKA